MSAEVKLIQQPSKSEKYTASETSCSQVPEEMDIDIDENSQESDTDWSTYEEYHELPDDPDSDDNGDNDDVAVTKNTVR